MTSADVSEVFSQIADGVLAIPPTAFGALGALGLVGAALIVADPEKRWGSQLICTYSQIGTLVKQAGSKVQNSEVHLCKPLELLSLPQRLQGGDRS